MVGEPSIALLEALDLEPWDADVRGRRIGTFAHPKPESSDRQRVREDGRLEVDVRAAVELGRSLAVDAPLPVAVVFEEGGGAAGCQARHLRGARPPLGVQEQAVGDGPGDTVLDRGNLALAADEV